MSAKPGAAGGSAAGGCVLEETSALSGVEKIIACPGLINDCACAQKAATVIAITTGIHLFIIAKRKSIFSVTMLMHLTPSVKNQFKIKTRLFGRDLQYKK
jgi:hypothetical protein